MAGILSGQTVFVHDFYSVNILVLTLYIYNVKSRSIPTARSMKETHASESQAPVVDQGSREVSGFNGGTTRCGHCNTKIKDGRSYCRLYLAEEPVHLCAPRCALRYFDVMHRPPNGYGQGGGGVEPGILVFMHGELALSPFGETP